MRTVAGVSFGIVNSHSIEPSAASSVELRAPGISSTVGPGDT